MLILISLEQVENAIAYLYNAASINLCKCEDLSPFLRMLTCIELYSNMFSEMKLCINRRYLGKSICAGMVLQ